MEEEIEKVEIKCDENFYDNIDRLKSALDGAKAVARWCDVTSCNESCPFYDENEYFTCGLAEKEPWQWLEVLRELGVK